MNTAKKLSIRLEAVGGDKVRQEFKNIGSDGQKAFQRITQVITPANDNLKVLDNTAKAFNNTLKQAASLAGAYLGLRGLTNTFKSIVETNKEFERLSGSLKTVTGSAEKAKAAFTLIEDFATSTPFQLDEIVDSFIRLKAMGLEPSMEALTSYGNTASAFGKNILEFVSAVTSATVGEFERLKTFGIKAKVEGERVKFIFQGVTTEVGKNAAEIENYLRSIGTINFGGAMSEQMNTMGGDIIPVFSKFKDDFPAFLIFRADRTNTDKDKEVNDTTKAIAKAAVAELESKFSEIKKIVIEQIQALADKTLLKLNEFDEHIAKELKTNIETKTLDSLFSFTFNCEDGISFNKRGSGIKRLMLLSFFLAEAERKNISKNIIYAIEEPETSQHPDFQIMLMNALKDLSDSGNRQILLTTHTPEIVKMINKEDLIFIQKDHENHMISVETNDDIEISKVADTLGILPFVSYKGVIFVEGKTDIRFLKNLSKIDEFRSIIDLTHFTFIELHGGGNIDLWIKANYLSGTNIKCLYFRDRDTSTTPPSVVHPQKVIITSKREIENYIPISSIEEKFDVTFTPYEIEHWNDMDVANSLYNKGIRFGNDQKHSENVIKQILQGQNIWNQIILSPENRSEIQDWFQQMKDFFEDAGW